MKQLSQTHCDADGCNLLRCIATSHLAYNFYFWTGKLTQKFILISLLPFKQKSVHLFWNSCKPVLQTLTQMFIVISLLPSKQVFQSSAPLYGQSVRLEKFLSMHLRKEDKGKVCFYQLKKSTTILCYFSPSF